MEYYSDIKEEWNNAICSNVDRLRDYYTRFSKSVGERQIPCEITYMWILKKRYNELTYKIEIDSQT